MQKREKGSKILRWHCLEKDKWHFQEVKTYKFVTFFVIINDVNNTRQRQFFHTPLTLSKETSINIIFSNILEPKVISEWMYLTISNKYVYTMNVKLLSLMTISSKVYFAEWSFALLRWNFLCNAEEMLKLTIKSCNVYDFGSQQCHVPAGADQNL